MSRSEFAGCPEVVVGGRNKGKKFRTGRGPAFRTGSHHCKGYGNMAGLWRAKTVEGKGNRERCNGTGHTRREINRLRLAGMPER